MTSSIKSFDDDPRQRYRCVCGKSLALADQPVQCQCGRRYEPQQSDLNGADTVSVDSASDQSLRVATPKADPLIGTHLQHFQIVSRIGDGGMGAVYHAIDESLQRDVAIKVIHTQASQHDVDRLFQEARAQARVNHPNVAHVYFVGNEDGTPFLAMELVRGGTLADLIRRRTLNFTELVRIASQITQALQCAALYDIVHGDIKPSNVLLVDEDECKLSDFGLARQLSKSGDSSKGVAGTPDYMSPELGRGGAVSHKSDMYALGVTLFQMTFGKLPITIGQSVSFKERMALQSTAPIEFPERWPKHLPESWKLILEQLLAKDPAERYVDFQELHDDLIHVTPIDSTNANPLLRSLAWIVDLTMMFFAVIVAEVLINGAGRILTDTDVASFHDFGVLGSLAYAAAATGILTLVGLMQAQWGTTLGKRFFQIVSVDQHGLKPRRRVLLSRSVMQYSVIWALVLIRLMGFTRPSIDFAFLAILILLGIEVAMMFLRQGRSLHDLIFGTKVVLDTRPSRRSRFDELL